MSTAKDLAWVKKILAEKNLGDFREGGIEVKHSNHIENAGQVLEELRKFSGRGWVCYTDEVVEVSDSKELRDCTVLSAELVKDDSSLHLRQHPRGGWLVVLLGEAAGGDQIVFREKMLCIGGGRFLYDVAWSSNGGEGNTWRPVLFRFLGRDEEV